MKALLDTSVMVAAHLPSHADYAAASQWLSRAKQRAYELVVSAHSLVEVYSVLTRLPAKPRIDGQTAWKFLDENVVPVATIVVLTADNYRELVKEAAGTGVEGGRIYDAIIARAAEIAQVDHLLTLNMDDFRRVNAAMASRVASPHTLTPP
jgi:predicted nucleic acid-binding protein